MKKRIIRVDLAKKQVIEEEVSTEYSKLGGRGLSAMIMSKEVDPKCDPLGPENKLIIAPGLFGRTVIPNCDRLSIGSKSPLTGGIKESNTGGVAGKMLSQHRIKAIILENASDSGFHYLEVSDSGVVLRDFEDDPYMGNYALTELFHWKYGEDIGLLSIGPAGIRKRLSACITGSDLEKRPTRAAGRGGVGAVMGSKGLKAIVIQPSRKPSEKATESLKIEMIARMDHACGDTGVDTIEAGGTLGLCIFISQTVEDLTPVYNAFVGVEISPEDMRNWTLDLLRLETQFNERAGVPPIEERVGRIFREEPLPESGNLFDTDYEEMKRIFPFL